MMDRLSLKAEERKVLGKKVKNLRKDGILPAHVFGKGVEGEIVSVDAKEFHKVFKVAGETGLIDLKISKLASSKEVGAEKGSAPGGVRPVLIREVSYNPVSGDLIHIDFYQVNLLEKVKVSVPIVQIGEAPESVKLGETIVLQTLSEVEVEALPADLPENIEVDITSLKEIDDAITVGQLNYDHEKVTVHVDPEEIVVKLAPAVSAETQALLEEQAAEQAAAAAETAAEAGAEGEVPAEGEVGAEATAGAGEAVAEGTEARSEASSEAPTEEKK